MFERAFHSVNLARRGLDSGGHFSPCRCGYCHALDNCLGRDGRKAKILCDRHNQI